MTLRSTFSWGFFGVLVLTFFANHALLDVSAAYGTYAWLVSLAGLAATFAASGVAVNGRVWGALIDERNVISLSRLQMSLWTVIVLSGYLTAVVWNIFSARGGNPLAVGIDRTLWLLMGISTTSLVGSPLILSTIAGKAPDQQAADRELDLLARQGDAVGTVTNNGLLAVNRDIGMARLSDLVTGEEVGNAAHVDVGRVQMLFFTLVMALAYMAELARAFSDLRPGVAFDQLPAFNAGLVALIGISHAGYLVSKAVPKTPQDATAPATDTAKPGAAGDAAAGQLRNDPVG
jgi:hypothetical protein